MGSSPRVDLIGETLAGVYQMERLLGRGSMGEVYAARNQRTGGIVAIKVLGREAALDEQTYLRFREEARLVAALRHPSIVQVFDLAELPDGSPYIVMEHLEGEDLESRLHRAGRLPLATAVRICRQVAGGLEAVHRIGVVHRDLKPANIILVKHEYGDEVEEQAKIIDFGLSHIRGTRRLLPETCDGEFLGTPYYASPEAARGLNSQLDGRSDQFALAVILYEMLSGERPFDAQDLPQILYRIAYEKPRPLRGLLPELPRQTAEAVERGMAKRKQDRFPTVMELAQALQSSAGRAPALSSSPGQRWTASRVARPLLIAVGLAAVLALVAAVLARWEGQQRPTAAPGRPTKVAPTVAGAALPDAGPPRATLAGEAQDAAPGAASGVAQRTPARRDRQAARPATGPVQPGPTLPGVADPSSAAAWPGAVAPPPWSSAPPDARPRRPSLLEDPTLPE